MTDMDDILTGVIVLLLVIVVWKWYDNKTMCGQNDITLKCGCKNDKCRCRGRSYVSSIRPDACPGGDKCICGCPLGNCGCPYSCNCQKRARAMYNKQSGFEGLENPDQSDINRVTGSGPMSVPGDVINQDYSDATKKMALENAVGSSHQKWCDSLNFNGLSTGASSCTTLEETGRSYGTADFVGLTARKFCKARQMATPADDARTTPSQSIEEWCGIAMDSLI
jgi:hypothetical protein